MRAPTITLLTDFGADGPYVGEVRAVLRARAPGAVLVDLTHEVPPHDIRAGAYLLAASAFRFPRGTVHLAVVDPGVGGGRRALAARIGGQRFVAPDNGLLTLLFERAEADVREIDHPGLRAPHVHPTFHGRDLFAPAAAALAAGLDLDEVGPPLADPVRLAGLAPRRRADGGLDLPVLHVDRFGNVTLGADRSWLAAQCPGPAAPLLRLAGGDAPLPWVRTYAEAPPETLVLLWGSSGFLELAVREGRAAERLRCAAGERIRLIPA